jgi:hypothetical protein
VSKMPKSVIKSMEKEKSKKSEKIKDTKKQKKKRDAAVPENTLSDLSEMERLAASALSSSALRAELAAANGNVLAVAEFAEKVLSGCGCVVSLDAPLSWLAADAQQQLVKWLQPFPVANRAAVLSYFLSQSGASVQLMLQAVAQAW